MRLQPSDPDPDPPAGTRFSDDHHDYDCSRCPSRGGPCLEALWLAQRLARGLAARAADLPAEFELTSETAFRGCGRDCTVRLRVSGTALDIACDAPGDDAQAAPRARVTAALRLRQALLTTG